MSQLITITSKYSAFSDTVQCTVHTCKCLCISHFVGHNNNSFVIWSSRHSPHPSTHTCTRGDGLTITLFKYCGLYNFLKFTKMFYIQYIIQLSWMYDYFAANIHLQNMRSWLLSGTRSQYFHKSSTSLIFPGWAVMFPDFHRTVLCVKARVAALEWTTTTTSLVLLVVLRIYVALAIFHLYFDLEAGDNKFLKP